ncbi:MAG: MFS transporter [Actinobacteria bacterium]|nr:MAG: MFS transporter [Actinomycetota bacterium]
MLWVGMAVSNVGDWLIVGALVVLVRTLSGSSSAVSGLMISKILPALFLGSIAGVLVDRVNRKRSMLAVQVLRGLIVLTLPFMVSIWAIYGIVFVLEFFELIFTPAKNASIPNIVEEDQVLTANSISYTTDQLTMIVGLSFGGVIVLVVQTIVDRLNLAAAPGFTLFLPHLLGPRTVFLVDSLSFFASALVLTFVSMRPTRRRIGEIHPMHIWRDLLEALRYMLDQAVVRSMIMAVGIAILGGGTLYSVGIAYTSEVLRVGESGYIFVLALFAAGMLIGAAGAGVVGRFLERRIMFVGSMGLFGVALLLFSTLTLYGAALFFAVVAGVAVAALSVTSYTYLQETVIDEMRGRVFAALESLLRISLLVSLAVTGPLADLIGTRFARLDGIGFNVNGAQVILIAGSIVVLVASVVAYFKVGLNGKRIAGAEGDAGSG